MGGLTISIPLGMKGLGTHAQIPSQCHQLRLKSVHELRTFPSSFSCLLSMKLTGETPNALFLCLLDVSPYMHHSFIVRDKK